MHLDVQAVNAKAVDDYLIINTEVSEEPWVHSVVDRKTVRMMLLNGKYGRERKAYGLHVDNVMIGYAVVHAPSRNLDLLHVAEDFRGKGYSKQFLQQLDIDCVSVDARNIRAVNLYTKLGYELEFFEE